MHDQAHVTWLADVLVKKCFMRRKLENRASFIGSGTCQYYNRDIKGCASPSCICLKAVFFNMKVALPTKRERGETERSQKEARAVLPHNLRRQYKPDDILKGRQRSESLQQTESLQLGLSICLNLKVAHCPPSLLPQNKVMVTESCTLPSVLSNPSWASSICIWGICRRFDY